MWAFVLGIVLLGVAAGLGETLGALALVLASFAAMRTERRVGRLLGVALLAAVTVADVVFTAQLARRDGAASIAIPALALGLLAILARLGFVRSSKLAKALTWLAFCGLGAMLAAGVPSRHDERLGLWVITAAAIVSADFLWPSVKPVAKLLLGDWEDDVGFLGDGRGRRERAGSPDDPTSEIPSRAPAKSRTS